LLEEDGVYSDLHASLIKRAEEAQRMLNVWEEKQKAAGNKAKL
jgi:hypothetical protein